MNIRQARKKIKSVANVRKITKAMQLVSAIKMKKAQAIALEGKPYREHLEEIINKVIAKLEVGYSQLLQPKLDKEKKRDCAIVIASNKGLCGGFNINLFRFIIKNTDINQTDFVVIGKKAGILAKFGARIVADYSSNTPLNNVSALFNFSLTNFLNETYDNIFLFYNKFISILRVEPVKSLLLPLKLDFPKDKEILKERALEYLIEPNPAEIINPLLHSFIEDKIQNAIIQNDAGEHSSRMIAMKNATENANDVIYNLTMLKNKLRQEKITSELLDMVTAKESVEAN